MLTGTIGLLANPSPGPGLAIIDCLPPMSMERLWAGDMSQLPSLDIKSQNQLKGEEPLLCNICEDQATGWHYGTILCEW